jgi:hypothetical protein
VAASSESQGETGSAVESRRGVGDLLDLEIDREASNDLPPQGHGEVEPIDVKQADQGSVGIVCEDYAHIYVAPSWAGDRRADLIRHFPQERCAEGHSPVVEESLLADLQVTCSATVGCVLLAYG